MVRNFGSILTAPSGSNRIVVAHQPVGVSIPVTPWPALVAGCTVVLKPASDTPLTAPAIADLLADVIRCLMELGGTLTPAQSARMILAARTI